MYSRVQKLPRVRGGSYTRHLFWAQAPILLQKNTGIIHWNICPDADDDNDAAVFVTDDDDDNNNNSNNSNKIVKLEIVRLNV